MEIEISVSNLADFTSTDEMENINYLCFYFDQQKKCDLTFNPILNNCTPGVIVSKLKLDLTFFKVKLYSEETSNI